MNETPRSSMPIMSTPHRGIAYAGLHGAVFLFGVAGLFGKWIAAPALLIVLGRVLVASLVFALLAVVQPPGVPLSRKERGLLAGCGALLAFHWFCFFTAIQVSTVAVGLLSYSTAPVFVVLLEPFIFRERWSWGTLVAALLCVAGVAVLVEHWEGGSSVVLGTAWGVASGLSFAVLSLFNRALAQRHGSVRIAYHQDVWAALSLTPFLPWVWQPLAAQDLVLLILLGVFCTALAHSLFIRSIRIFKAGVAAIASALEPVYGIGLAVLLLGEIPTVRNMIGGGLILLAVICVSLRPKGENYKNN